MVFNQNDRSCYLVESMDPHQRQVARQREEAAQLRVKVMQDQRPGEFGGTCCRESTQDQHGYSMDVFTKQLRKRNEPPTLTEFPC